MAWSTSSAVHRYHRGRAEVTGFTVSGRRHGRRPAGALESLRWAFGVGVAPVLIADALADGVRTVAKVSGARGGNSYALASQLGMPPWKVDKARKRPRGWSSDGLAAGMAVVAELNAAVKGAAADPEYALEKAVIDLVDGASSGSADHCLGVTAERGTGATVRRRCPRAVSSEWLTRWASADLRFAAWFAWMTPFDAALSRLRRGGDQLDLRGGLVAGVGGGSARGERPSSAQT